MKTLIANWKANPTSLEHALELFDFYLSEMPKYQNLHLVVCPPFVYLEELAKKVQGTGLSVQLGAQDTFWEKSGPYTGEISIDMLKNFGVTCVLVGHSDRRYKIGETDEVINKKIKAALEVGIMPVLLVGERNRNDDRRIILEQQFAADLDGLSTGQIAQILIAYEPVWAISTQPGAEPETPQNTLESIGLIQEYLSSKFKVQSSKFLYGGSINSQNAADFLKHPEISGAVIGGASLRKEEFAKILETANEIH